MGAAGDLGPSRAKDHQQPPRCPDGNGARLFEITAWPSSNRVTIPSSACSKTALALPSHWRGARAPL